LGYISLAECVSVSLTTFTKLIGLKSYRIWRDNANYTAITPFKVINFDTNRKPICDFLLVINSNLPPILHRFQVMADYWWNFR